MTILHLRAGGSHIDIEIMKAGIRMHTIHVVYIYSITDIIPCEFGYLTIHFEPVHEFGTCRIYASSEGSDEPSYSRSLARKLVNIIRKYHKPTLQTNPRHREEESQKIYSKKTSKRQQKQSNQHSLFLVKTIAKLERTQSNAYQNKDQHRSHTNNGIIQQSLRCSHTHSYRRR